MQMADWSKVVGVILMCFFHTAYIAAASLTWVKLS